MNKSQLINYIAAKANLTKTQAAHALNAFMEGVTEALTNNERVQLVGFGTFSTKNKAAYTGRNPKTGEAVPVAAKKVVKFKAGKGISRAVNDLH